MLPGWGLLWFSRKAGHAGKVADGTDSKTARLLADVADVAETHLRLQEDGTGSGTGGSNTGRGSGNRGDTADTGGGGNGGYGGFGTVALSVFLLVTGAASWVISVWVFVAGFT